MSKAHLPFLVTVSAMTVSTTSFVAAVAAPTVPVGIFAAAAGNGTARHELGK